MYSPKAPIFGKQQDIRGFSLIEVLIAIAVLSVGILAIGTMQIASMKGNAYANNLTIATTHAQRLIERMNALPFDDPLLDDGDGDGSGGLNDQGAAADGVTVEDDYTISWNVAQGLPVNENTKLVRVIVTWNVIGFSRRLAFDYAKAIE
jgi:prepilin-type N-terminal cleavage/methylation domain-containing protein